MNKKYIVDLSDDEREILLSIVNKGKGPSYRIKHAYILLNSDINGKDLSDQEISELLHCHSQTVVNVRKRLVEFGLESALERKKRENPPIPRKLDGDKEARLFAVACSQPPEGRRRWTLQLLADELVILNIVDDISAKTVGRTLKKQK
jgi:hypothetical protein